MNRLSPPVVAVAIAIISAVALAFGGNYLLAWFVGQDSHLAADVFGKPASTAASDPFGSAAPQATDNVAAARDTLLTMLSGHFWIGCAVAAVACVAWVAWYTTARINDVSEGRTKGRPVWLALLLVVVVGGAALLIHARYMTPPGANISGSGMPVATAILAGLPLLHFLIVTRLIAPNRVRSAIPY